MLIAVDRIHTPMNVVKIPHSENHTVLVDPITVAVYQAPKRDDYTVGVKPFSVSLPGDGLSSLEYVIARFDTESEGETFIKMLNICAGVGIEKFYPWYYNRETREYEPPNVKEEMLVKLRGKMNKSEMQRKIDGAPTAADISRMLADKQRIIEQRDRALGAANTAITALTEACAELEKELVNLVTA